MLYIFTYISQCIGALNFEGGVVWQDDDPHSAHQDSSPGCSFWRKSSTSGQRLSREMFSGYGSPYHSMFRSAGSETSISGLPTNAIDGVLVST